jgi:site-specific recombinase XerD
MTNTKVSKGRGVYYYLFELPDHPNTCPVRTTLAFKESFEREFPQESGGHAVSFIHYDEKKRPLKRADQIGQLLKQIHNEAGIDTTRWGPNNARHAVITFYQSMGVSLSRIKLITGHNQFSKVTQEYYTLPSRDWSKRSILAHDWSEMESIEDHEPM